MGELFATPDSLAPFLLDPQDAFVRAWVEGVLRACDNLDAGPEEQRLALGLGTQFREAVVHALMPDDAVMLRVARLLEYFFCAPHAQHRLCATDRRFLTDVVAHSWGVWITGRDRDGELFVAGKPGQDLDDTFSTQWAWQMCNVYRGRGWHTAAQAERQQH